MNIIQYDDAIRDYLKYVFDNTVFAQPTEAFKANAMTNNDRVKLPMISVFRESLGLGEIDNFPRFKKGEVLQLDIASISRLRTLPVMLRYQVDVWATSSDKVLGLFSEVLFYILDYPAMEVPIPNYPEELITDGSNMNTVYLRVSDIIDNTDISLEVSKGRIYRYTIMIELQGFIFKSETRTPIILELEEVIVE